MGRPVGGVRCKTATSIAFRHVNDWFQDSLNCKSAVTQTDNFLIASPSTPGLQPRYLLPASQSAKSRNCWKIPSSSHAVPGFLCRVRGALPVAQGLLFHESLQASCAPRPPRGTWRFRPDPVVVTSNPETATTSDQNLRGSEHNQQPVASTRRLSSRAWNGPDFGCAA